MKRRIQAMLDDLASDQIDLLTAMRKTYNFAKELGCDELACWINKEIVGYGEGDKLPEYRNIHVMVNLYYNGINGYLQMKKGHLDMGLLDEGIVESLSRPPIRESLSNVINFAEARDNINIDLSMLIDMVHAKSGGRIFCASIYQEILKTVYIGICDMVRQKLTDGLLGLLSFPTVKNQGVVPQAQFKMYDVFLSHASQDKLEFVDGLYKDIKKLGVNVFYDTDSIGWGDRWKEKILQGTKNSEFAIIIVSEHFFGREWTEKELYEFLSRENETGQKIVLPIVHNISIDQLRVKYPELAEIQALPSNMGTTEIALRFGREMIHRLRLAMGCYNV